MKKDMLWLYAFRIYTIAIISLALVGGFIAYSPIPFWDAWNGYLEFFTKVSNGDYSAWWAQHNEHRIILSRLLFWMDLKWFGGLSVFLITLNYVFCAIAALVFSIMLGESLKSESRDSAQSILGLFLVALLFFWSQENNLTWGFQSQFFLAYILPLTSFYFLQKDRQSKSTYFVLACCFGFASMGAMANGVLALPLMTIFALITKQRSLRVFILTTLSLVGMSLYFYGYHSIDGHGSLIHELNVNPLGLVKFILLYLGSPFHFLIDLGFIIPAIAGLFFICSSVYFALKYIENPNPNKINLALVFFIIYIFGAAAGTAGGRLSFGLDAALSSRYTTPALMGWAALLVLFSSSILSDIRSGSKKYLWLLAILATFILVAQTKALKSQHDTLFERKIASIALELGVRDQLQIGVIFPSASWALQLVNDPLNRKLSIFGIKPLVGLNKRIGEMNTLINLTKVSPCIGNLDQTSAIDEGAFVRISGWLFNRSKESVPDTVTIIDNNKTVVGFALTGQSRVDVKDSVSVKALYSGFKGYILRRYLNVPLVIVGGDGECLLNGVAPNLTYSITTNALAGAGNIASVNQIKSNNWLSKDTVIFNNLGFLEADSKETRGSITILLKRGQSIYYRTGSRIENQHLSLPLLTEYLKDLPQAPEWILLTFDSPQLPDYFNLTLTDQGSRLDEWSSVGLRK